MTTIPQNYTRVYIDNDAGFIAEEHRFRSLGTCDKILRDLADASPRFIRNFAVAMAVPLSLSANKNVIHVWGVIPELNIKCAWAEDGGSMVPNFRAGESGIILARRWKPPANMKMVFCSIIAELPGETTYKFTCNYLVAVSAGTPGWRRLPLSNFYEDARLCDGIDSPLSHTLADVWAGALDHFMRSTFNSDLVDRSNAHHTTAMFRFDKAGVQLEVPHNWEDYCPIVNSTNLKPIEL